MTSRLRYLVPSAVTFVAMACGVLAIRAGLAEEPAPGCWWILTATIFDRLDGFVARKLNATSQVGMWLDSISDFVAFGVAPAFLLWSVHGDADTVMVVVPMILYIGNCAWRLANFSLAEKLDQFAGVPSTLAGGVYAAGLSTAIHFDMRSAHSFEIYAGVLLVFGFAMNQSWIRYGKVGGLHSRLLNIVLGLSLLLCSLFILLRVFPWFVFAISGSVMLTAPLITRWDQRRALAH